MKFEIMDQDIFSYAAPKGFKEYSEKYRVLVHCISADKNMIANLSIAIANNYMLRSGLSDYYTKSPDCAFVNGVMNLITKDKAYDLATYESIEKSLIVCRKICIERSIKYLVMPRIGCDDDSLNWFKVSEIIKSVFADTNVDILICTSY